MPVMFDYLKQREQLMEEIDVIADQFCHDHGVRPAAAVDLAIVLCDAVCKHFPKHYDES